MQLRRMERSDLDSAGRLLAQLGYEVPVEELAASFDRIAALPDHLALVAVEGDRLVGWAHAFATYLFYYPPFVEIAALVVDEAQRRSGVGRELVRTAERWALEQGCSQSRIRSRLSREEAHRFYVRLGYAKEKAQYTFAKALG